MVVQSPRTPAATPVATQASQEEGRPSPPPVPTSEGMTLTLKRADQMLSLLRPNPITRWEPEAWTFSPQPTNLVIHIGTPPQAAVSERQHLGLGGGVAQPTTSPPAAARQPYKEEGNPSPTSSASRPQLAAEALAILELDGIEMWDPEEEILSPSLANLVTLPSTSPLATVTESRHCSPGVGVFYQLQSPLLPAPASTSPLAMVTVRRPFKNKMDVNVPIGSRQD